MNSLAGIFLVTCDVLIGSLYGTYTYTSIDQSATKKPFEKHEGIHLQGRKPYLENKGVVDYNRCILACDQNSTRCKSINIWKTADDRYNCNFFKTSYGNFQNRSNVFFVSRDPPVCSTYCSELEFLDLCGSCRCAETKCGSLFNHYCDCTKALPEAKGNCKEIQASGFRDPAMFSFRGPKGQDFHGFCETREDPEILWLTMGRRFSKRFPAGKTTQDFVQGFHQPHDVDHWLGLERLHHFTQQNNTILRVEVATYSHHYQWYGEYGNFKITKSTDGTFSYTATDYRTNFCLGNGFASGGTFADCTANGKSTNGWFNGCKDASPYKPFSVVWGGVDLYQRITLLLRHGDLTPMPQLTPEMGTKIPVGGRSVGVIPYLGPDFCISFKLFTKTAPVNNKDQLVLCLKGRNEKDNHQCLLYVQTWFGGPKPNALYAHYHLRKHYGVPKLTSVEITALKDGEWMSIKLSQIKKGSKTYKFKTVVDDNPNDEFELTDPVELRDIDIMLGRNHPFLPPLDGQVHDLYVNGEKYL